VQVSRSSSADLKEEAGGKMLEDVAASSLLWVGCVVVQVSKRSSAELKEEVRSLSSTYHHYFYV
jgi:hypothetical protein